MQRRTFLATVVATGTLTAGCLGDGGTEGGGPTERSSPTTTASTEIRTTENPSTTPSVAISSVSLQRGLVVPTSPDSIGLQSEDKRYLWAKTTVSGGTLSREEFSVVTGQNEHPPASNERVYRTEWQDEDRYEDENGWLLFELPLQIEDPDLVLQWPHGEYPLDDGFEERLGRSPPTMNATFVERDREQSGTPVAVEATNEGDVAGRYLGAINRQGGGVAYVPVQRLSFLLEPGETKTVPVDDSVDHWSDSPDADGEPDVRYDLSWPGGSDEVRFGDA